MLRTKLTGTVVVAVVCVLVMGAFLLSSCVAPDGTVYRVQPIAAEPDAAAVATANKQFILDYFAALNQDKSPATVDKYMTDEVLKEHIVMFETAFPGYQLTAEEMVAQGDMVFVRTRFEGTHDGDLMGIAPTGKPVTIEIALTYRIENGKIVDHWMLADLLGVMQQIGVMQAQ
ncbi:MAG: ester cyclase [Caldilineaceae bacterium]